MRVLTKPNLENAILLKELIVIMENFGIYDEEGEDHDEEEQQQHQNIGDQEIEEASESKQEESQQ